LDDLAVTYYSPIVSIIEGEIRRLEAVKERYKREVVERVGKN
jgi:hypothetical protein